MERVNVIPFNLTNHGGKENFYIYTIQDQFHKGGNRLCTTLYHTLKRIKNKEHTHGWERAQAKARELVCLGDNVSENKCNTLFAFFCELIFRGWYDSVEIWFGPVGHTHNGNDAVHHIHNNIAGDMNSVSLPALFNNFYSAWPRPQNRDQNLNLLRHRVFGKPKCPNVVMVLLGPGESCDASKVPSVVVIPIILDI